MTRFDKSFVLEADVEGPTAPTAMVFIGPVCFTGLPTTPAREACGTGVVASSILSSLRRGIRPPIRVRTRGGDLLTVDFELESAAPFAENKIGKQKVFEKIAPFLRTGEYGVPEFCGRPLMTSAGVCTSSITNGSVS